MIPQAMIDAGNAGSTIREIAEHGAQRAKVIGAENVFSFAIGNPSVPAPACVQETIERLLHTMDPSVLHAYTAAPGLESVRQKIADYLQASFGVGYRAGDLYLTHGASSALAILPKALLLPGEEILTLTPYFPEYKAYTEAAGGVLTEVKSDPDTFQMDLAAVRQALSPNTKAVLLNSPNNPSGVVLTKKSLLALAEELEKREREYGHPIYLIADEPYRELVYGGLEVAFIPSFYKNTLYCYSFSKALSLPGERVGWILVPNTHPQAARLMPAVAGAARTLGFVCAPALFQRVIIDCIDEPSDVEAYARNRTALTDALAEYGYTYVEPDGAFYLWVKALEPDANAFCERAKKYELLAVPSDSFGMPGWFRLGYCVSYETIVISLPAWKKLADEYL